MMLDMAAGITAFRQANLQQEVALSVTKMTMEAAEQQAATLVEKMAPPSPYTFDVYA